MKKTSFWGYLRPNGQVGIRNRLLVLSSVSCANDVVLKIAHEIPEAFSIIHQHGCGHLLTEDINQTRRMLINSACNPNIGACLVVGLGCELMEAHSLAQEISCNSNKPVAAISIQNEGGTVKAIRKGCEICQELLMSMQYQRTICSLSNLTIGIFGNHKESLIDNYSMGGNLTDLLLEYGISVIQSESAELYPLRNEFLKRSESDMVRQKLNVVFSNIEHKLSKLGVTYNDLTTGINQSWNDIAYAKLLLMGKAIFNDVINTGEISTKQGLIHMESTLFTPETISSMGASSAQLGIYLGKRAYGTHPVLPVYTLSEIKDMDHLVSYFEQDDDKLLKNNYSFAITRIGPST